MKESEAVQMMSLGNPSSIEECRAKYSSAVAAGKSPMIIREPGMTNIDPEYYPYLSQVSSSPIFQQSFHGVSWEFKVVDIDTLVCFQRHVDLDYVGELREGLTLAPEPLGVLKFCLPISFPMHAGINVEPQSGAVTISSKMPNLMVAGVGINPPTPVAAPSIVFTLGVNANYVQVVKHQDRYILRNGYHRVYALRASGQATTPCVYFEMSDYSQIGADRPGFFGRETVHSDRPPTMKDFFDEELSADIKIQPTLNVIRIRAEQFPMPLPEGITVAQR